MIRLDPHLPGLVPPEAPRERGADAGAGFARTLDELAGAWYRCTSTPLADADRPVTASAQVAGPVSEPGAAPTPAAPRARAATETAAAAANPMRALQAAVAPTATPSGLPQPQALQAAATAPRAGIGPGLRQLAAERALQAPMAPQTPALPLRPGVAQLPLAPLAGGAGPAASQRAAAAPLPPPRPEGAAPAAFVATVLQSGEGRRTLAMRCPPLLRETALALARQWLAGQHAQAAPAAPVVVINGGVVAAIDRRS